MRVVTVRALLTKPERYLLKVACEERYVMLQGYSVGEKTANYDAVMHEAESYRILAQMMDIGIN